MLWDRFGKFTEGLKNSAKVSNIENDDYKLTIAKFGKRKNVIQKNYSLTLDMAKELSMV